MDAPRDRGATLQGHNEQSVFIISMDVLLVHFHGQVDLPDEFPGGALTTMEGFWLYLPGDSPFLTTDAQGIAHDAQLQGGGIHAGG